jgi:hypothetical protein
LTKKEKECFLKLSRSIKDIIRGEFPICDDDGIGRHTYQNEDGECMSWCEAYYEACRLEREILSGNPRPDSKS